MCAQRQTDLATMVQVMLDHMPDDPLARAGAPTCEKLLIQIVGCPAGQAVAHRPPGNLKPLLEFGGIVGPAPVAIPHTHRLEFGATLAHPLVEPPCARSNNVDGNLTNAAQIGRDA